MALVNSRITVWEEIQQIEKVHVHILEVLVNSGKVYSGVINIKVSVIRRSILNLGWQDALRVDRKEQLDKQKKKKTASHTITFYLIILYGCNTK